MRTRRVLLLELNEITWTLIDPLIAAGKLPTFARLKRNGAWGETEAPERPPHLDPWVTWVTLHTGVPRELHGATVLEQDVGTIAYRRTWEYAAAAGATVGVFGSIGAHPPPPLRGFVVPGPFAPDDATHPRSLAPIQRLNRGHTRAHGKNAAEPSVWNLARDAAALVRLGLRPATCGRLAAQLLRERLDSAQRWRRVGLQPLVNLDPFTALWQQHRPHYATFHSNHVAHYMHHYWRAHDDRAFLVPSPPEERRTYGDAVTYGYELADELLARCIRLVGDGGIVVVASSMGQQPYVRDRFPNGRVIVRFRDVRRVLALAGVPDVDEIVPVMVPQVNVRIADPEARRRAKQRLEGIRRVGGPHERAIEVTETGEILTLTPYGLPDSSAAVTYHFPPDPGGYPLAELFATDTPTPKQGMHHPTGVLALFGAGIRRGVQLRDVSTLDVAPTILTLLGVPVPSIMRGRVLREAWRTRSVRFTHDAVSAA
jgi:hypothetical protein